MPIINQVVSGGGGSSVAEPYINWEVINGELVSTANHVMDFTGVVTLTKGMTNAYKNNTSISGALDMSSITTIDCGSSSIQGACFGMFEGCTGITSFNLSGLQSISMKYCLDAMLKGCSSLVSADLSGLKTISGQYAMSHMFNGSGLESFDLSSLATMTGLGEFQYAFQDTKIITAKFESLKELKGQTTFNYAFYNCAYLQDIWFYTLKTFGTFTNIFNNMLSGVSGCTVHFPMVIQSTIGSWTSVTGGFGGTNTTVSFDLVTSLTGADSNTYTRSEKDSTSTATAWLYNDTLYYTSGVSNHTAGVNEPSVADTIYSDAACITSVTTITAIA